MKHACAAGLESCPCGDAARRASSPGSSPLPVLPPFGHTQDLTGRSAALPRAGQTGLLTVSLEDYFQVGAFGAVIPRSQWYWFESRVERAAARLLDLLDHHDARATVFVLGVVAESFPELVRAIRERGHEVASKGYQHRPIRELNPGSLADDLARAREAIERATGERVLGCRISGWLTPRDRWALDVIAEQGYVYDSSMRPLLRSHAMAPATRRPHLRPTRSGLELWELPVSSVSVLGFAFPIAGGNWMRQLPAALVRRAVAHCDRTASGVPLVFYFHSWELDPEQPRIAAASPVARLRHYRNLHRMPARLRDQLAERRFVSVREWLDVEAAPAITRSSRRV